MCKKCEEGNKNHGNKHTACIRRLESPPSIGPLLSRTLMGSNERIYPKLTGFVLTFSTEMSTVAIPNLMNFTTETTTFHRRSLSIHPIHPNHHHSLSVPFILSNNQFTNNTMCSRVKCRSCGKPTWSGCGQHIQSALGSVKEDDRCPNWKQGSRHPCGPVEKGSSGFMGSMFGFHKN